MFFAKGSFVRKAFLLTLVSAICLGLVLVVLTVLRGTSNKALGQEQERASSVPQVKVVKPRPGGMGRSTLQPGSIHAFEFEEIFAKVSGYLVQQKVDIGSRVKKGDLLAQIDAPELLKEEQHAAANLEQAKAQVRQMEAHVNAAKADLKAAQMLVLQREAEVLRSKSNLEFRKKQYERIYELAKTYKSVDEKLVDEQFEQLEAARSWRDAAVAAVNTAHADVEAKKAKVTQAEADLSAATANVDVARATLEKAAVFVNFTKIRSHYDGVVTRRYFHNGDFIRAADKSGTTPIFTVQRTDLMRLIVQIPDSDVPFCDAGDPVDLFISTLPGEIFPKLKVSRVANSQDERSRTMRMEVDIPNKGGLLRDGMYGEVTVHLQGPRKDALTIPSSCLHQAQGKWYVHAVRAGAAYTVPVKIGQDNGHFAEVLSGLKADDLVVTEQARTFADGTPLRAIEDESALDSH